MRVGRRIRFVRITGCLALLCVTLSAPGRRAFPVTVPRQPPAVILISIDTLRADHLSAYGYRRLRSPAIEGFAEGGTLFTQVNAQIPLTLPSHTSLLTSTYPFENQTEENGERIPSGAVTLASVLRSHGYRTAAFIGSDFLGRRYGLDQGFDLYDSPFHLSPRASANPVAVRGRRDGALVLRAAREWLTSNRGQAVFAFIHLFDMHTPYELPPSFVPKRGISCYDGELEYVDQLLGRFRQTLQQEGWWDRSLVILLSDHGEGLGEHGESAHGYFIYQSTLWVPLIFHWPTGATTFPSQVSLPVGLIDVAPTILEFLGFSTPPAFEGRSLLSLLLSKNAGEPRPVYSESLYTRDAFHWAALRSLRVGNYKYIDAPKPELYDLRKDPHEQKNIEREKRSEGLALKGQLSRLLARASPRRPALPPDMSPETQQLLESLGYLSADPRQELKGKEKDPKDGLAEFRLYEKALRSLYAGHTADAIPVFRGILTHDARNTLARFHLGECYRKAHSTPAALREWQKALEFDPGYAPAAEALGEYWLERRDYTKARSRFLQALAADPNNYTAHLQLGVADRHLGRYQEALEHVAAARRIAPDLVQCQQAREALEHKRK